MTTLPNNVIVINAWTRVCMNYDDISNTKKIEEVINNGRLIER